MTVQTVVMMDIICQTMYATHADNNARYAILRAVVNVNLDIMDRIVSMRAQTVKMELVINQMANAQQVARTRFIYTTDIADNVKRIVRHVVIPLFVLHAIRDTL